MAALVWFILLSVQVFANTPRVAVFADSQFVGAPGAGFLEVFDETFGNFFELGLFARCGFRPSDWFQGTRTPHCGGSRILYPSHWSLPPERRRAFSLFQILEHVRPDLVIFSLGGNLTGASEAVVDRNLEPTLRLLRSTHTPCIWISPLQVNLGPRNTARRRISRWIQEKVRDTCNVIDGGSLSFYPRNIRGLHYAGSRRYHVRPHDPEWVRKLAGRDHKVSLSELGIQSGRNIGSAIAEQMQDLLKTND